MILTNNAKTCREHTDIRSETKLITNKLLCFLRKRIEVFSTQSF